MGVERDEIDVERRALVQLRRALDPEPAQLRRREQAEDPVGAALLDGRRRGLERGDEAPDDRVRIAIGLRRVRPLAEVRVAREPDLAAAPIEDPVGAGPGRRGRADVAVGDAGGDRCRVRVGRELEEEVRVRRGELEDDGAGRVVGPDTGGEVAARPPPRASVATEDAGEVVGTLRADAEQALDRAAEVAGA